MIEKRGHKALMSIWDIKNGPTSGSAVRDLSGSWSCPICTYLNDSYTSVDVCVTCGNVCASRRYEAKRQKIAADNLADIAADLLFQQNDFMNDLIDDSDDEIDLMACTSIEESAVNHLLVAPQSDGKQLHLVLLPDLLLDCISYLSDPRDIMNLMSSCKYFSLISDSDSIWWPLQSRFINDLSSSSETESRVSDPASSSSTPHTQYTETEVTSRRNSLRTDTWICAVCQLTQALASSTVCEMCTAERPVSTSQLQNIALEVVPVQTAFIIVKSAEHLAALWIEGNKRSRERENNLMQINSPESTMDRSVDSSVPFITPAGPSTGDSNDADSQLNWDWHVGLPGVAFVIDRARAVHTVRAHTLPQSAGKWFYRCKIACLERKNRQHWQSIHRGWEWIRKDLRSRLRTRWIQIYVSGEKNSNVLGNSSKNLAPVPISISAPVPVPKSLASSGGSALERDRKGGYRGGVEEGVLVSSSSNTPEKTSEKASSSSSAKNNPNYQAYHTCEKSAAYVTAIRSEAIELKESIRASGTLIKALRKLTTLNWVMCYESIKAELSLQAEALALDMKSLWSTLRPRVTNTSLKSQSQTQKTNYSVLETCTHGTARSIGNHSPRSLPSSLHNTLSDRNDRNTETERKTEKETVELCQMFLNKLNRACAAFIGWADELEENCVALNDEIAKDKDRYREGAGLSSKAIDENTGLFLSQGTPSISEMSLIALRNHSLLNHWVVDAVLICIGILGADTDTDTDTDTDAVTDSERRSVSHDNISSKRRKRLDKNKTGFYELDCNEDEVRDKVRDRDRLVSKNVTSSSSQSHAALQEMREGECTKKRQYADISNGNDNDYDDSDDESDDRNLNDKTNLADEARERRKNSMSVLMQLYDLCEVLDVEDDLISTERDTRTIFKKRYIQPLCALYCLASPIRTRNSELDGQAYQNRSNQWEGDDIHFSYTRDRERNRDGPFDPRRDQKVNTGQMCIEEDRTHDRSHHSNLRGLTTHVLKVDAISSCETFHADFDPKLIRRRQLIELYS